MSRIAKKPLELPDGVTVTTSGSTVTVKGKNGELSQVLTEGISIKMADDSKSLTVERQNDEKRQRALQGTYFRLINNMVVGVNEKYTRKLEIVGVGYRVALQGKKLVFQIGFCHPVEFPLPEGITAECPSQTEIILSGIDKQLIGQAAADIRAIRKPEPYKGKGIKYAEEVIRRKAGKAFASK